MQYLEPHDLIEASPLFHMMQPFESEAILALLQPAHYECGSLILERGTWHGRLYIIASGQVSVLLPEDGTAQEELQTAYVVARLGPGECFGEMSLITGEPPGATIRAEQDTVLWSLTQTDFLTLIGSCPTLLRNINTILSHRLADTNRHLTSQQSAQVILLNLFDEPGSLTARSLPYHIAHILAQRSHKRVLLLELCAQESSHSSHFVHHPEQFRPTLLTCVADHHQLQRHRAPTCISEEAYFPALTTLADTQEQLMSASGNSLSLFDLALMYDYLLLVATPDTPSYVKEFLRTQRSSIQPHAIHRAIILTTPDMFAQTRTLFHNALAIDAVFIVQVQQRPTMGLQERYAEQLGLPITRLLPADDALLDTCWQQQKSLSEIAPQATLTHGVDFVARYLARQTVGIAFGGGGARGFAHLGVLAGLLEHHIPLDYIAACSIGIMTPGMYLMGKSLEESEEMFMQIQHNIIQWNLPRTSIMSNRGIKHMLRQLCGNISFEDLETPFAMVAADLATRSGVVMNHGPLWQAALASVALPGIFPPVVIGKHILIDAGMHDPVPIRVVRRMGADILLASELGEQEPPALTNTTSWQYEVHPSSTTHSSPSPHIVDILLRSYELAMATIGMHSIREADVVIRPKLHRVSLRQFSEGRKFVAAGREALEQTLPALRTHLPWL
jgi:NTE family protein